MLLKRLLVAALVTCSLATLVDSSSAQGKKRAVNRNKRTTCTTCSATPAALTELDAATLKHMYEEEKLALNFYQGAYGTWKLAAFSNISAAEKKHRDAIANQIALHKVSAADVLSAPDGTFVDPALQSLYDRLMAQSESSVFEALQAAGLIEEVDITDLKQAIAATAAPELKKVYGNLESGSENHLKAVVRQLAILGVTYAPQALSAQEFSAMTAASSAKRGQGMGQGQRKGAGNGNGGTSGSKLQKRDGSCSK